MKIEDSEDEIERIKEDLPGLGVHAFLDQACEEVFDCSYEEFNEEFDSLFGPIKRELGNILDKAEPVLEFILGNLYGRYTSIRESLHEYRLADLEMTARSQARYYLTLIKSGIDEETAMKMMNDKFKSEFDISSLVNGVVEKATAKIIKLVD